MTDEDTKAVNDMILTQNLSPAQAVSNIVTSNPDRYKNYVKAGNTIYEKNINGTVTNAVSADSQSFTDLTGIPSTQQNTDGASRVLSDADIQRPV